MKTSSKQLKLLARRSLLGNYGMSIGAQLAMYGITMGVMMVLEVGLIFGTVMTVMVSEAAMSIYMIVMMIVMYLMIFLVEMMLMPGLIRLYMNFCTNQKGRIGDVFFVFKNHPWKFVRISLGIGLIAVFLMVPVFILAFAIGMSESGAGFMVAFYAIYWLLLSVAAVYVSLSYGMFYFIIVEDPDKGVLEALAESRQLMKGNRWRFFCLGFSFLGMILLGYMSLGIGFVWIFPYITCTSIQFYLDLKPAVEVYPPEWQSNMQAPQWEMRPEPPVTEPGYAPMPEQPVVEPGYERMPEPPVTEPGYASMPEQMTGNQEPPVERTPEADSSEW